MRARVKKRYFVLCRPIVRIMEYFPCIAIPFFLTFIFKAAGDTYHKATPGQGRSDKKHFFFIISAFCNNFELRNRGIPGVEMHRNICILTPKASLKTDSSSGQMADIMNDPDMLCCLSADASSQTNTMASRTRL